MMCLAQVASPHPAVIPRRVGTTAARPVSDPEAATSGAQAPEPAGQAESCPSCDSGSDIASGAGGGSWLGVVNAHRRRVGGRPRAASGPVASSTTRGIIPVLARAVREVEAAVERGSAVSVRTKFQVVALLVREERARVRADGDLTEAQRDEQLKRLDGVATMLARTAARDTVAARAARRGRQRLRRGARCKATLIARRPGAARGGARGAAATTPRPSTERRVVPRSVISRQLANPFLAPDFEAGGQRRRPAAPAGRLGAARARCSASFEYAGAGATACMPLPEPARCPLPGGRELMPHQAQVVEAAARGPPHLPARRRARARQDRAGAARRPGGRRLPAAGRGRPTW